MKKKLQEVTDYKVMSAEEAMTALGFTWEDDGSGYLTNITCSCGQKAECSGFIGCESIRCNKCNKEVLDLSSPIPTGNSTVGFIDLDNYEIEDENKYWIAIDGNGGIKVK